MQVESPSLDETKKNLLSVSKRLDQVHQKIKSDTAKNDLIEA
jgi:hypothetical protein